MGNFRNILNTQYHSIKHKNYKRNYYKKEIDVFIVYVYILTAFVMILALPKEYITTNLYYSSVILLAVMFAGLAQNSKKSFFYYIYMGLSFAILFFTYGFRDFSAIDDGAYGRIFESVSEIGWINQFLNTTMEPGYLMLNYIVSMFTHDYLYMQLITSFIPLFLFYYGFKKYRNMISIPTAVFFLCTMLYFQMISVALIRMFIGISIIFVAFYYIPKRKPIKYMSLVILASIFHYSAFFLIFLTYFAINKKSLSKKATRTYLLLFIMTPFIFIIISKFIVPLLGSRYSHYGSIESIEIGFSTFTTLPLILFLLLFYRKFHSNNQLYFKLFLTIYALSIIISLFGGMVGLGRLIFYSYAAFILASAMIGKLLVRDSKKLLYTGVMASYGFLYVYVTQFTLDHHVPYLFPYENLFFTL